jgi:hypothetical protein
MEHERASTSLHEQLLIAIERATLVVHDSATLVEQHHTLVAALRETAASINHRRSGESSG